MRVYTTKGEYLCTAKRVEATHPMAYHMGSVSDMQDFKQKIKKPKQLRNRTLNTIKKYIPKEDIKFIEAQMIEENVTPTEIISEQVVPIQEIEQLEIQNFNGRPVFMNNYERYEWLMENGCTNPEDRKWLAAYKNSDEYQMIYGNEE